MKSPRPLIPIFIVSIILTSIGYLIDSDPPYPNFLHTILEFVMLTLIIAGLLSAIYILLTLFIRIFYKKKNTV